MKKKRYFCDNSFVKKFVNDITASLLNYYMLLIIGAIIFSIIGTNVIPKIYSNKINNSYTEEDFDYIYEIAEEIIDENGINLSKIPERIYKYEIIYKDEEIKFKYYLKKNSDSLIELLFENELLYANVTLSKKFEILDKWRNFSSKEEYEKHLKEIYKFAGCMCGGFTFLILVLIFFIAIKIGCSISIKNKEKHKKIVAFRPKNVTEHFDDPNKSEATSDYYNNSNETDNTDTNDED